MHGYYHGTEDGDIDLSHPMTHGEVVELYWAAQQDEPSSASDIYFDFHKFDVVQFILFADRLSSAILVYRAARNQIEKFREQILADNESDTYATAGWGAERKILVEGNISILNESLYTVAGAVTVAAVAALESLLKDLDERSAATNSGLQKRADYFLGEHSSTCEKRDLKLFRKKLALVARRRNQFAHNLTGSYFDRSQDASQMFTDNSVEETFQTVADLGIGIERMYLHKS